MSSVYSHVCATAQNAATGAQTRCGNNALCWCGTSGLANAVIGACAHDANDNWRNAYNQIAANIASACAAANVPVNVVVSSSTAAPAEPPSQSSQAPAPVPLPVLASGPSLAPAPAPSRSAPVVTVTFTASMVALSTAASRTSTVSHSISSSTSSFILSPSQPMGNNENIAIQTTTTYPTTSMGGSINSFNSTLNSTPSWASQNTGAIVGIVVGIVSVLIASCCVYMRNLKRRNAGADTTPQFDDLFRRAGAAKPSLRRDIAAASRTIAAQKESNVYESIPTNPQGDFIVAPISDVTAHESDNQYSSVEKTADTAASPFPEFSREHQFSQLQQQQVDQHAAYAAEYYHQQQQYYAQQQQQYYQQYYQQHTAAAGQNPTAAAVYQQGSGQPTVFSAPLASQYYTSDQLHQVLYGAPPVTAGATTAPSVGVITPGHTSGVPTERQAGLPAQRTVELPAAGVGEVKGDLTENRTESLKTVGVMRTAARISRVDQWSAEDVCAWVFKNNLAGEKTCRLIREQDIDGHALLLLTNDDMENGLGLLKLGQRVKFGNAVSVLQVGVGSTSSL